MRRLILTTVSVIALGLGSGLAYAAGDVSANAGAAGKSTMPSMAGGSMSEASGGMAAHNEVMEAQRKLQADNLYQGEIDGIIGPQTKQALREYQSQHGLRVTANLDQETRNRLLGPGSGGSSHPPGSATPMTPSTTPAAPYSGGK